MRRTSKLTSILLCLLMMVLMSASSAGYVEEEISENQDRNEQPETRVMDEQEANLDVKDECEDTSAQNPEEIPTSGPTQAVITDPAPLAADQPPIANADPAETVDTNEAEQFYGSPAPPGSQNVQGLSNNPAMTTTAEYVDVDLNIRVAGTKGSIITMALMVDRDPGSEDVFECRDNQGVRCLGLGVCKRRCGGDGCDCSTEPDDDILDYVIREPGPPNTGGFPARIYLTEDVEYTLEINAEPNGKGGANPVIFSMVFPDGEIKSLKHTFNHQHGWSWIIPDSELKEMLGDADVVVVTTVSDSPEASFPSVMYPSGIFELAVGDIGVLADVNVKVDITHANDSDIEIALMHPSGVGIMLTSRNGGSGDNYKVTTFDDEADESITSGSAPFNGSYRPEGDLSDFDGLDAEGTWKLYINDVNPSSDDGVLHWWSLELLT